MNNVSSMCLQVRNFLLRMVNKEFLIFLFFLFLSGTFWLLMTLNETYECELQVPTQVVETPRKAVITSTNADTLRVTVRDKGYVLLAYYAGQQLRPLTFRYSTYAKSGSRGVVPHAEIARQLNAQLFGSTKLVKVSPDHYEFTFTTGDARQVEVKLAGRVQTSDRYYLADTRFWPAKVTIYAPKQLADSVKAIYTEQLNIAELGDTLIREVALQRIPGVKIVPSRVKVGFYPDVLTEESIEVPITAIHMPADKVLRTFPAKTRVEFVVGASEYRSLKSEHFTVAVDYNDIAAHPSAKCPLYLLQTPAKTRNARLTLKEVDYLVEQK